MDPRDAARDTSGARAYSQFLVEMGERVPAVALPNVSVVLTHLDEEVRQEAFVCTPLGCVDRKCLFKLRFDPATLCQASPLSCYFLWQPQVFYCL